MMRFKSGNVSCPIPDFIVKQFLYALYFHFKRSYSF